ncbi:MAG: hypothetical protein GY892_12685 [Shimia sp.]|nr:hypothetical protein [Shimia sp.]
MSAGKRAGKQNSQKVPGTRAGVIFIVFLKKVRRIAPEKMGLFLTQVKRSGVSGAKCNMAPY